MLWFYLRISWDKLHLNLSFKKKTLKPKSKRFYKRKASISKSRSMKPLSDTLISTRMEKSVPIWPKSSSSMKMKDKGKLESREESEFLLQSTKNKLMKKASIIKLQLKA